MSLSKSLKEKIASLSSDDIDRCIRMGWEDRTTFESINHQFQISPNEFVKVMRHFLDKPTFKRWRRRVTTQGHLKNEGDRGFKISRFKCSRQSVDGITKGWK
ncbi:MAG: TIGR03643 family protein [Leptospira sp.]|nr:TIGR03643 family protein [Leptospira sp.]